MTKRRKFLLGMGSLAAGGAAAIGSGAFTSVTANRDMTVTVADDSNALLSLEQTDSANSDYVTKTGDVIGIDVSGDNDNLEEDPSGVNNNATTIFRRLFDIRNQGTQGVLVWVENQPDDWGFFADNFGSDRPDTGLGVGSQPGTPPLGNPVPATNYLQPGESLTDVGFFGGGENLTDVDLDITIQAASPDEIYFRNLGEYDKVEQYNSASDDPDFSVSDLTDVSWRPL